MLATKANFVSPTLSSSILMLPSDKTGLTAPLVIDPLPKKTT